LVRKIKRQHAGLYSWGVQKAPAQSIMGATLKRRDGSGRVVSGLEPVLAVISFNVFGTECWILGLSSKLQGRLSKCWQQKGSAFARGVG